MQQSHDNLLGLLYTLHYKHESQRQKPDFLPAISITEWQEATLSLCFKTNLFTPKWTF